MFSRIIRISLTEAVSIKPVIYQWNMKQALFLKYFFLLFKTHIFFVYFNNSIILDFMKKKNTTKLPYSITTATLTNINFLFDLSEETTSPISVHQLLDLILTNINQETKITGLSNGDVIQSLAMALAVRMKMVNADDKIVEKIVIDCVSKAINAAKKAEVSIKFLVIPNLTFLQSIILVNK